MKKLLSMMEYVLLLLISLFITVFLTTFILRPAEVSGSSMYPTLADKEKVFTNVFDVIFKPIERFDIVVIRVDAQQEWVKRVIALPNESIEVKNNKLYINDIEVQQPFLASDIITNDFEKVTLKDDEYFVMGDNREHSSDSRMFVKSGNHFKKAQIISKHAYVYYPFNAMRVAK